MLAVIEGIEPFLLSEITVFVTSICLFVLTNVVWF
jgi:hypothetical protein